VEQGSNDFALVLADRRSIAEIDERRAAFRLLRAMSSIPPLGLATYRESGMVAKERRKPTRLRQSGEIGGGSQTFTRKRRESDVGALVGGRRPGPGKFDLLTEVEPKRFWRLASWPLSRGTAGCDMGRQRLFADFVRGR
jgi:hypothetical protein